jgi:hypothetical protein
MTNPSELALREREIQLQENQLLLDRERLYLEHARLRVEFAKFGFVGTLTASLSGLVVVVILAAFKIFGQANIETWGIVAIAVIILLGSVAFGYFSLWELPRITGRLNLGGANISAGLTETRIPTHRINLSVFHVKTSFEDDLA